MTEPDSLLITPEDFRRHGRETVDWVADYLTNLESYPVLATSAPGEIAAMLPSCAPEKAEPFASLLADLDRIVLPGTTHWQSPSFFAYFPANASPPAILGDLVAAGLGVNGMLWATSPACTEIETVMLDWLVDLLGLPARFRSEGRGGGVIQDSASSATLCALLAARERATGAGAALSALCVYTSAEAHSSVRKSARIAGFSPALLRLVEVDDNFGMDPAALEAAMRADRDAGLVPCGVVATAGTTSSMGFDPIRAIGELCNADGAWLHVDAAMAGSAAVCPELRSHHDGIELADSYAFNPHKWLLTNFDCDCLYVADRASLTDALSVTPEYLRNDASASGSVLDYRDWQVPLGRRFRALKLWFVLRSYGAEGLRRHVREHVRLAEGFAGRVDADRRFELCAPPVLNLTCFRHIAGDEASERLLHDLNATGNVFLSHTRLGGRFVIRCCIGGTWTTERHVRMLWDLIDGLAPTNG
jgi:aromatic-L-amino-acid decarboxylase